MKLTVNKEYKLRHLFAAAVFAAAGCWFFRDGLSAWPRENEKWRNDPANAAYVALWDAGETPQDAPPVQRPPYPPQKIRGQIFFGTALCGIAAFVVLMLAAESMKSLEWDPGTGTMKGSLTGGKTLDFRNVEKLDLSKWRGKRVARVVMADGRKIKLDAWHHAGAAELVRHLRDTLHIESED